MDENLREALYSVVTYLWADEEADFIAQDEEGRENHIFHELRIIQQYLSDTEE